MKRNKSIFAAFLGPVVIMSFLGRVESGPHKFGRARNSI